MGTSHLPTAVSAFVIGPESRASWPADTIRQRRAGKVMACGPVVAKTRSIFQLRAGTWSNLDFSGDFSFAEPAVITKWRSIVWAMSYCLRWSKISAAPKPSLLTFHLQVFRCLSQTELCSVMLVCKRWAQVILNMLAFLIWKLRVLMVIIQGSITHSMNRCDFLWLLCNEENFA